MQISGSNNEQMESKLGDLAREKHEKGFSRKGAEAQRKTMASDAYDLLMEFVARHLPDPFYLEGALRVSLREKIFREIVSNLIVHREYTDAQPATLIIYRDRVETTNACTPHGRGPIHPDRFTPFPKNPTLSKFFMQMGRGEELGSGVLNVNKYLPFYTKGAKPRFIEDAPFVTMIPLPSAIGTEKQSTHLTKDKANAGEKTSERTSEKIMTLIEKNPAVSARELGRLLGLTSRAVELQIQVLKNAGRLRRIGPPKGGRWDVISDDEQGGA